MNWQLSLPKTINTKTLEDWSKDLRKQGVPRQVIFDFLLVQSDIKYLEYFLKTEYQISDAMVARNLRGKHLEKTGNIEEAIKLYEANVADGFSGNYPYNRLRVIYTNQKSYDLAIRICKAFVNVANSLLNTGTSRGDLLPKRERFIKYIERLEQAKNRSKSE
jgi:tetratricopeptide (TPR) repeat protein